MTVVQWLVYLFLFLLPTQFGKHFFLPFSFINGIRIDYLAPTMYVTDLFVLILLAFQFKKFSLSPSKKYILLGIIFLINILFSLSPFITMYKIIKIGEIILLFYCIQIKLEARKILISFIASGFFQLILSLFHLVNGKAVQGLFYFFGERYFTISTPGIAKVVINGIEVLRPYGTFSHPNSLAGFFLLLYAFVLFEKRFRKITLLKYIFLTIASLLIFLSFSKIAIILLLIVNVMYISQYVTCKLCFVGRIIVLLVLSALFLSFQGDPASTEKRIRLMKDALSIIIQYPLFGTGLGAYLYAQSQFPNVYSYYFLQPVHNVFFLLIAELGIPSTYLAFYFLSPFLKKKISVQVGLIMIGIIVSTGLFDHYWLTLQQNMLLLPVVFGLLKNQKWG